MTMGAPLEAEASSALPQTSAAPQAQSIAPTELIQLIQGMSSSGLSGPMTTMQPTMSQPSMPPEFKMGPGQVAQGPFGSVGERKRADAQATINNLANISQSFTNYWHDKKVREYSTTIEKVMNAQGGMVEAKNAAEAAKAELEQAKQTGDKQATLAAAAKLQTALDDMQHNQDVLSTVGADPKTAKILEKAFSVKLIGDDKGKASPEYQALQQAIKSRNDKAQKAAGLAMMQKFQATQPTRQQISPQYQAMAQLIKDKILPSADARTQAIGKIADATIQAQGRLGAAELTKQAFLLNRAAILENGRLSRATQLALAKENHQNRLNEILERHKLAMQELNPLKQAQMLNSLSKTLDDAIGTVKLDNNGNVVQSSGLQGAVRRTQKEIDDIMSDIPAWQRAGLLSSIDEVLASKHPFLLYGITQTTLDKLKQVKALQQDIGVLNNQIKAFEVTKIGIGKTVADVGAKGVYGGAGSSDTDTSDSEGVSGESTGDSGDDAATNDSVNILERSFGYPDQ